jgi:hypothetical protein
MLKAIRVDANASLLILAVRVVLSVIVLFMLFVFNRQTPPLFQGGAVVALVG